jgi:hypothetical protein
MPALATNRDLYTFVSELCAEHQEGVRSLERYLCALWRLAHDRRDARGFALDDFANLLHEALDADAGEPDLEKLESSDDAEPSSGYEAWERAILRQIRDLREMAEADILTNDQRYFGVTSPRGGRWYNFDPLTFLECGVQGTFGGWQSSEDTRRVKVTGKVMVLGKDGSFQAVDPDDVPDPEHPIERVSWDAFRQFLLAGQMYE